MGSHTTIRLQGSMVPLTVHIRASEASVRVRVAGELERANSELFLARARPALQRLPIEMHLGDLTFMDLGGIRALEHFVAAARRRASCVSITEIDHNVARVLRLAASRDVGSRIRPAGI